MSAILKNCPFCGGEAKLYPPTYAEDNPSEIVGPACVNCHDCCAAIVGTWEDDAIEAWNRRDAAHLISAAPDLLDALRECQAALAMMVSPNSIEQTTVANAFAAATAADVKARAAIAKAEGRQP